MTVKEIGSAVGKDERTVRRWINSSSDKMSSLSDKMSEAEKTKIPAEYTLEETIAIIETGMGKNAAAIFRTNANAGIEQGSPLPIVKVNETRIDRLESIIEKMAIIMMRKEETTSAPLQIENKPVLIGISASALATMNKIDTQIKVFCDSPEFDERPSGASILREAIDLYSRTERIPVLADKKITDKEAIAMCGDIVYLLECVEKVISELE